MSSLFSRKSAPNSASSSRASSLHSVDRPAPPVVHDVLTQPAEGATPKKRFDYTPEQLQKIEELREYTKTIQLPESDPYYPWEQRFLNDPGCHPRYCRAGKWRMDDCKKRIKGTMEWRRDFKPDLITPADVKPEAQTGKIVLNGFDVDARPILYLRPGRENTETSPRQIRHMIWHLERAIDFAPPGQEQVTIIVDYKSATSSTSPSLGKARQVLSILQNHYVERLGRGLVINMPWFINAFFTGLSPFLDPVTRDKIRFNPNLVELVPPSHLDFEFGGDHNYVFDHDVYWKTITEYCHLAEDGTRVDNEGKPWIPPLGNGIAAAASGFVPKPDANATGEMTKDPEAGSGPANKAEEKVAAAAATGTVTGVAIAAGEQTESQKIAEEQRAKEAEKDESTSAGVEKEMSDLKVEDGEIEALETAPGAPKGEVVFDHPPSKAEKAAAS